MKYGIGFLIRLSYGYADIKECPVILIYQGNHFSLKRFDVNLLGADALKCSFSKQNLNTPIFYIMEKGEFKQMFFLSEFQLRLNGELTGNGIELYAPYIGRSSKINDDDWSHLYDSSADCNWNYLKSSIYVDGIDVFRSEDYYPRAFTKNGKTYSTFPEATFFPRLSISRYIITEICSHLYQTAEIVRNKEVFSEEGLNEKKEEFSHYLDTINLDEITKGLKIHIAAHYRHKAGDDDFYTAEKIVELENDIANNDPYLRKIIEIGTSNIYTTHSISVPSYAEDSREYSELEIEEERNRIKADYSKERHMMSLVLSYLRDIYDESYDLLFEIPSWIKRLQNLYDALFEDYKLIIIKGHQQVCKFDLKWYIYDNVLYRYNEIDDELLTRINDHLRVVTECDFESFRKRGVTKMGYWYFGYLYDIIQNL